MNQRYEVKGRLGHGGLGEVYLAYDTQLDREVALKRVKPQEDNETSTKTLAADLVREAKTLSALQHPKIVTIYDVGTDEKGPFVIMEYLKGETLDQVIERGRVTVDDFREIVLQCMEGMVAAGSMGLVHRDLKPGNVMVNWLPSGKIQLKILDFGLAKFSQTAVPQTQDQGAGIFGSIFFMAPEQFERLPLDARTDLYSLGCIFYQLLTQKHPFAGRTPVDVMVSHLQHLVTPLHEQRSDVPQWMADWVMWLISREMEQRPGDARTAMQYFMEGRSGLPAAAPAQPARQATTPVKQPPVPRPNVPTQPVPPPHGNTPNVAGFRARPGAHARASASRGRPRRLDGHVKGLPKEKVHGMTVLTGLIILGIAFIIGWKIYQKRDREKEDPRLILERYKGDAPEGDAVAVAALLDLAKMDEAKNMKDVEAVLKKLQGPEVPVTIATEIEGEKKGPMRDMLIRVAAFQPSKETIGQLSKVAGDDFDSNVRTLALESLTKACGPTDIVPLLSMAVKFQEEPVRTKYFKTIEYVLAKEPDRDHRVAALAPALKNAGPASQPFIFRLIGATGSPEAPKVLAGEISSAGDRRRAAMEALKSWNAPDMRIAEVVFDAAKTGDHDTYVEPAARTYARVPTSTAAEVVVNLRKLQPLADTPISRGGFAAGLGTLGSKEALDYATELSESPDEQLASAVKEVLEKIKKQNAAVTTLQKGENIISAANGVLLTQENAEINFNAGTGQITGWRSSKSRVAWDVIVTDQAVVEVEVVQSSVLPGNSFFVTITNVSNETDAVKTNTSDDFMRVNGGKFELYKRGAWRIYLEPGRMTESETFLNVKSIAVVVK